MGKTKGATVRFVYGIFFSLLSVLVGALFIRQIWSIYASAPQSPYSVESISLHFKQIALPVWLWVAAVAGNILLAYLFPEEKGRPKAYRDRALALSKAKNSLRLEGETLSKVEEGGRAHQDFRNTVFVLCAAVMVALSAFAFFALVGVIYLPIVKSEFFSAGDGLVDRLVQCAVLSVLALAAGCVAAELNARSREKEREVYLQARTGVLPATKEQSKWSAFVERLLNTLCFWKKYANKNSCQKNKTRGVWLARTVIFALAIALIVVGIFNGGMQEMFLKAINICTQCIGLG